MSVVAVVLRKELRETLRDRRTVAVMVLLPLVVYPLVSLLTTEVLAAKQMAAEARTSRVAVVGADADAGGAVADVRDRLLATREIELVPIASAVPSRGAGAAAEVSAGRIDALVEASARRVRIDYDQTREPSVKAQTRVEAALAAALPPGCAPRYTVDSRNVAPKRQLGGYVLSKILPLLVVLMTMLGAFYPAIDITAGERERGTLETLLASPVRRLDLMAGKVLAAATLAALTGVLNIAAMSLTVSTGAHLMGAAGTLEIPWTRAAATVLTVVPAAFLFAAAMVAIGALARSFKEAQNLLTPLYFLCLVPSLVASLADFSLQGPALLVPGVNVTLLARDLMLGAASPGRAALVLISTAAYGAVALGLAARLYDSERLLAVPDADRVPLGAWLRHLLGVARRDRGGAAAGIGTTSTGVGTGAGAGATSGSGAPGAAPRAEERLPAVDPSAGHALALAAIAWVLWFFLFSLLQRWRLLTGLVLTQAGFAAVVLVYARLCRRPLREVLVLARPRASALVGAALLGLAGWVVLGAVVERFFPPPPELVEQMRRMIHGSGHGRPLVVSLLVMAVAPAICEEALFRGPVLRGLARQLPAPAACLVTGVLFGLFHGDVWRFAPTAALGTLLAWLTLASGSIFPAILAHCLNNGALVILGAFRLDERLEHLGGTSELMLVGAALGAALVGVLVVRRGSRSGAATTTD
jgi:sodium transport system permease protein